jgi:hypothetical protein
VVIHWPQETQNTQELNFYESFEPFVAKYWPQDAQDTQNKKLSFNPLCNF